MVITVKVDPKTKKKCYALNLKDVPYSVKTHVTMIIHEDMDLPKERNTDQEKSNDQVCNNIKYMSQVPTDDVKVDLDPRSEFEENCSTF